MKKENLHTKSAKEFQKEVRLSSASRERMQANLMAYADNNPASPKPVVSPYASGMQFLKKPAVATVFLFFFAFTGTAFASQNSLPGDLLYPIKTQVVEPVVKFTKQGADEKASFELALADKRIAEVEQLVKEDKATERNLKQNKKLFDQHLTTYEAYERSKENNEEKGADIEIRVNVYRTLTGVTEEVVQNVGETIKTSAPQSTTSTETTAEVSTSSASTTTTEELLKVIPEVMPGVDVVLPNIDIGVTTTASTTSSEGGQKSDSVVETIIEVVVPTPPTPAPVVTPPAL